MNFDLSGLSRDQITSAKLKMYAQKATLNGDSRTVGVYLSSMSSWMESTLTHKSAPNFSTNAIAMASINVADRWYEWDLTSAVKENAGSKLALVVLLTNIFNNNEELVNFASKDTKDPLQRPKLVIETLAAGSAVPDASTVALVAGIAVGVGGGVAGLIFYRKSQQKPGIQPSQISSEATSLEISCPNCSRKVSKDFNICPFCEHDLRKTQIKCQSCGKDISIDYKVCPFCGSKISP